jgi:predicted transglutaminase-like cysteine proteinase
MEQRLRSLRLTIGAWRSGTVWFCLALCFLLPTFGAANFEKLLSTATARWGPAVVPKFNSWSQLMQTITGASEVDRVRRVNTFFNQLMTFGEDTEVWSQVDYWATPMESLGRSGGDCEDYAIAKYFTLLEVGVPIEKMRLVYVKAKQAEHVPAEPHMVLAYYAQPDSDPLILDNLVTDLQPASRRTDLTPVFSFNSKGIFSGITGAAKAVSGGIGRLSRWEDLLKRARADGFE